MTKKSNKKTRSVADFSIDPNFVHFIPLGGSEQFGVNLNVYGYQGKWLAIDCGIGFAGHRFPGIDLLLPDPEFIADRADDLVGLIVTHAHEDHVGAVAHLWSRLRCPIYCTAFTASVLRQKFNDLPGSSNAKIHVVSPGQMLNLAPFEMEFIHVAHSIPQAVAVAIKSPHGHIVHSGDWNLDPEPVIGDNTDAAAFKRLGDEGVLAYIGDSTNAEVPGNTLSEMEVQRGLTALFGEVKGRIAITIFASNIGRVHSICKAAEANGRSVALLGRSLHRMTSAARECGYLNDVRPFLEEDQIDSVPDENLVMIVTGSQGEARAMLARIARAEHPFIRFNRGDTVIFSARPIPGNEEEINVVKNNLSATGVHIVTPMDTNHLIHVSGHPYREDILEMFSWVRPKIVIPVHGERVQLAAQSRLALGAQVSSSIVPNNGSVIRLDPKGAEVVDHVRTGTLAVEPSRLIPADHQAIATRRKLQFTGTVHVTLVVDDRGDLISDPRVSTMGLIDHDSPEEKKLEHDLVDEIEDLFVDLDIDAKRTDDSIAEEVRIVARRFISDILGLKPKTSVHVVRV